MTEMLELEDSGNALRARCDVIVVVGIGGSYLGTRAVLEALSNPFETYRFGTRYRKVIYAGHVISEDYMHELTEYLDDHRFGIINISKSGTTTEPALAFRILKKQLEDRVGLTEARRRIMTVTDGSRGALHEMSRRAEYDTYVIPDDVGGRFSVFSPVGLLPIVAAGYNIRDFLAGAYRAELQTGLEIPFRENPAALYAAARSALYRAGKKIELLANFNPKLHYLGEWWKQLFGESEGKEGKGIFPAAVDFTTDLHSMGQWIQEGERSIFETVLSVGKPQHEVLIPSAESDLDGLNYLSGRRIDDVARMAELGTQQAHIAGGVPNIRITVPELTISYLGELLYIFEKACGISGYMLGINPFNQPGVEAYKRNMFKLLKKPGY
jgi:glucose-6-phosphate isomerase